MFRCERCGGFVKKFGALSRCATYHHPQAVVEMSGSDATYGVICTGRFYGAQWPMPWRRKPVSRLRYWSGGNPAASKASGFKTILVYCVGPPTGERCWHWSAVPLDRLPAWDWYDICAHLRCTKCGSVGWVDPRPNWCEVIDFNKGVG